MQTIRSFILLVLLWRPTAAFTPMTLDEAVEVSDGEKPIVVWVHAVWCGPCKAMEKEGFSDPRIKRALQQFVQVDMEESMDGVKEFYRENKLFGFPTLIFYSPTGQELSRTFGYENPQKLLKKVQFGLSGKDELEWVKKKVRQHPERNMADEKLRLMQIYLERGFSTRFAQATLRGLGDLDLTGRENEIRSLRTRAAYLAKDYGLTRTMALVEIREAQNADHATDGLRMLYRSLKKLDRKPELMDAIEDIRAEFPDSYYSASAGLYYAPRVRHGLTESIRFAQNWLERHGSHQKADKIRSRLADAYADQGDPARAVKIYRSLSAKHPEDQSYERKLKRYKAEVATI